jgi:hypothetical protein
MSANFRSVVVAAAEGAADVSGPDEMVGVVEVFGWTDARKAAHPETAIANAARRRTRAIIGR